MGEKIERFHNSSEPNRMPNEVIQLSQLGREVTVRDVEHFSLDDMIMYIINFLVDPGMHRDHDPVYDPYTEEIARECAYSLGEWFWTIFTSTKKEGTSRCTRRVAPY
jgi:hypothetical protein